MLMDGNNLEPGLMNLFIVFCESRVLAATSPINIRAKFSPKFYIGVNNLEA